MKNVTYDETLAALKAAVEEKGAAYVYEREEHPEPGLCSPQGACLNTSADGTKTGCIVGNALVRLGVSLKWLALAENINCSSGGILSKLRHEEKFRFDTDAGALLAEAQSLQDNGIPWGEAVDQAAAYVKRGSRVA